MSHLLRVYAEAASVPADEHAIALYRLDGATRTLVAAAPGGFSLAPIDGVELAGILGYEPADQSRNAWLRSAGLALYERLAPEPVAGILSDLAPGPVMLELMSRELASVPWELCRRPGVVNPLFADPERAWFLGAYQAAARDERMVAADWPLRVLVVVGSEPGDERVQAVDEVYALENLARGSRAAGPAPGVEFPGVRPYSRCDMLLYTLFQPDLDELKRTLYAFKPHVFHFIGHGRLRRGEPELRVYSGADQVYHPWGYDQIGTAFPPSAAPRLVYLDACHSGTDQPDAWSLAQAFRDIGAGAIIAMQKEITGSSAVALTSEFYAHLIAGASLEGSLAHARRAFIAGNRDEWYLPRLWVRGDPDRLRPSANPSADLDAALARCPKLERPICFVDRWPQRYQVWREHEQAAASSLLLLWGASKTGKTAFAHWLMEAAAFTGRRVCYVDLVGTRGDYSSVLDRIARQAEAVASAEGALGPDPFAAYREFVQAHDVRDNPERAGHHRERVMRLFWDGLRALALAQPWFLVLDHVRPGPFSEAVVARELAYELLLDYRPPDTLESVRVAMLVTGEQAQAVRAMYSGRAVSSVELGAFSELERNHYLPLYFDLRCRDLPESVARQLQGIIVSGNMPCPEAFEAIEPLLLIMARNGVG